ncbi:tail fiber/spike domain-containing protein [Citrobacter braakii]|uniref:tail fiber/spike domain-containing protein n=1 Tax=Citrobacter braakii TaxID=57706 RepID=UPI00397D4B79
MSTTPTNQPVPSESPRDLKFNAGKIDEFVTSMARQYIDRFGQEHYTIEGISWVAQQAIAAFGYITLDSFEDGNTLTLPNQALRYEATGEYYRWDGDFPKTVPAGSTPETAGGVGIGAWVGVGDAALRTELQRGQYREDATSCFYVPGFVVDETTNNRDAAFSFSGYIYIPEGITIRCNFLPDDDVRKFVGGGIILSMDPWGFEHVFDVSLSIKGSSFSPSEIVNQGLINYPQEVSIGAVGDSITDGAWGKQGYTSNPNSGSPDYNLTSTNYNHSTGNNGGSRSWLAHMAYILNLIVSRRGDVPIFKPYNASLSGMKLSDGWAYRNFDYGFFQNSAYKNEAPDICVLSMGWNDENVTDFEAYLDRFDAFIRKSWGYGSSVLLVSVNRNARTQSTIESAIKDKLCKEYSNVEYVDLSEYLEKYTNTKASNLGDLYIKTDGSYDITHPQPMGHAALGSAAAYGIAKNHIPKLKSGETLIPYTNKYFDCVGSSSGAHYQATARSASGNGYLSIMKRIIGWSPSSENVSITSVIFVDDDDSYLTVLEPFTHDFTAAGRNHTITVTSPAGIGLVDPGDEAKRTIVTGYKLSSNGSLLGDSKTTTTGVCKLRYGLNVITLTYDGAPKNVYAPYFMVTRFSEMGSDFRDIRLNFNASTEIQRVYRASSLDKIAHPRMSSNPGSFLPNTFGGNAQLAASAKVKSMTDLTGVVVFYDDVLGTGTIIQRRSGTYFIGNIVAGAIVESSMVNTSVAATGELNVGMYYGADGKPSIVVADGAAGAYSTSAFTATGGTIGVYTPSATTLVLSYQATFLDL